jgi:hypothetical protein
MRTTCFNIKILCIFPTHCIDVFCAILRTDSEYFLKHQQTDLSNRGEVFSVRSELDF